MKFVVLKHTQPAKQVPFPRRKYLEMMAGGAAMDGAFSAFGAAAKASETASETAPAKEASKETPGPGQDIHYDLMLESDDGLMTWAMGALPKAGENCGAIKLPPHREHYLTYEGPVSEDRGTVKRVMAGTYKFESPSRLQLNTGQQVMTVDMEEIQPEHFRFTFSVDGD